MLLRDRAEIIHTELSRGVNLTQFAQLQGELTHVTEEQKKWNWLYSKLDFLERVGALVHPKPHPSFPISIRPCWVNMYGWFDSDPMLNVKEAKRDDIDTAPLSMGNIALKTKIIMMDDVANLAWNSLLDVNLPSPIDVSFCRLLVFLASSYQPDYLSMNQIFELDEELRPIAETLANNLCGDCDVFSFLDGKWIIAHLKAAYINQRHCYLALPLWVKHKTSLVDWNLFY